MSMRLITQFLLILPSAFGKYSASPYSGCWRWEGERLTARNDEDLQIYVHTTEKCNDFKRLGSLISSDRNWKQDTESRVGQAGQATQRLNSLLRTYTEEPVKEYTIVS